MSWWCDVVVHGFWDLRIDLDVEVMPNWIDEGCRELGAPVWSCDIHGVGGAARN